MKSRQKRLRSKLKKKLEEAGIRDEKSETEIKQQMDQKMAMVTQANVSRTKSKTRQKLLVANLKFLKESKNELYRYLSAKINLTFDNFLLDGNSSGFMHMNIKEKSLKVQITAKVGNKRGDLDAVADEATTHLHNLSGGEKTKTMLAFLLAINRSAPTPWFIMDEVGCLHVFFNMLGVHSVA